MRKGYRLLENGRKSIHPPQTPALHPSHAPGCLHSSSWPIPLLAIHILPTSRHPPRSPLEGLLRRHRHPRVQPPLPTPTHLPFDSPSRQSLAHHARKPHHILRRAPPRAPQHIRTARRPRMRTLHLRVRALPPQPRRLVEYPRQHNSDLRSHG